MVKQEKCFFGSHLMSILHQVNEYEPSAERGTTKRSIDVRRRVGIESWHRTLVLVTTVETAALAAYDPAFRSSHLTGKRFDSARRSRIGSFVFILLDLLLLHRSMSHATLILMIVSISFILQPRNQRRSYTFTVAPQLGAYARAGKTHGQNFVV